MGGVEMTMPLKDEAGRLINIPCEPSPPPPKPLPIPQDCEAWRDKFNTDKYPYWWYKNVKGEKLYIVYKQTWFEKGVKKKRNFQGSYGDNHRYIRKNLWTYLDGFKLPLFRLDELVEWGGPILINEGEGKTVKAQEYFPDYFCTCFSGGKGNYTNVDWSVLKDRDVTLWADSDHDGKGLKAFQDLAYYLKDNFDIKAKLVPVPTYDEIQSYTKGKFNKNAWDLEDEIPEQVNIRKLLEKAEEPIAKVEEDKNADYYDIRNYQDKFVYISSSVSAYWDRTKKRIRKEGEIDRLFLGSKERQHYTRYKAHEWLHRNGLETVEQTAFYPMDKEIFYRNGTKYLNLYRKPYFKPLDENQTYDYSWFMKHIEFLSTNEPDIIQLHLDTIASAVQRPEENRTWALMHYSGQGVGKNALHKVISKLVGPKNCSFLEMRQLVGRFQSFLMNSNNLFIAEANSKGQDDSQIQSTLKQLISDDLFQVERKGIDMIEHFCHYNLYLATNQSDPIRIDKDDRRICYINVEYPSEKILKDDPDYFTRLFDNIDNDEQIRGLNHYFLNIHKISEGFNLKHAPWTRWKEDLIVESKPFYIELLDQLLEDKILPCFHYDLINQTEVFEQLNDLRTSDSRLVSQNPNQFISKKMIQRWVHSISGSFKIRDYAIQPGNKARGQYWVIRNFDKWRINREDTELINQHFNDEVKKALIVKEKQQHAMPF